jgi:hypothetical protein
MINFSKLDDVLDPEMKHTTTPCIHQPQVTDHIRNY